MAENYQDPIEALKKEFGDQFKEMNKSLGKLEENTKPAAKVAKAQISHAHRPNAPVPKIELGKDTRKDLLSALKDIRKQLVVSQQRETTMGGIAADVLASGGGLGEAAKAAVGFKTGKAVKAIKHKFDPLNIIHKLTGGSKLITALAGRVMGRSEQSIRSAAGLAGGMTPETSPGMGTPSAYQEPPSYAPTRTGQEDTTPLLLEQIATDVSKILERVTQMQAFQEKSLELTKDQLDAQKDAAVVAGAKKRPSRIMAGVTKAAETGGDLMKWLSSLISMLRIPMLLAIGGLIAAGTMLYKQWEKLKLSFSLLKESAVEMWDTIKHAFSDAGTWITDKALMISDAFMDAIDRIVEFVQETMYKFTGGVVGTKPQTSEEKQRTLEQQAAQGNERAQRKLTRQVTEKVAKNDEIKATTDKLATQYASKVASTEALQEPDTKAMAVNSLLGKEAPQGTPEKVAAVSTLSQMSAKAYGAIYKDAQGNPLSPSKDVQAPNRLPAVVEQAATSLSQTVTEAPTAMIQPPSMLAPAPTVGAKLNDAADMKASAQVAQAGSNIVAPVVNTKTINNTSHTIVQPMPGVRSDENSLMRSRAASWVPA